MHKQNVDDVTRHESDDAIDDAFSKHFKDGSCTAFEPKQYSEDRLPILPFVLFWNPNLTPTNLIGIFV